MGRTMIGTVPNLIESSSLSCCTFQLVKIRHGTVPGSEHDLSVLMACARKAQEALFLSEISVNDPTFELKARGNSVNWARS